MRCLPPARAGAVLCAALAAIAFCVPAPATAASLDIMPVRLELGPEHPVTRLEIRNRGAQPVHIQLDVRRWRQVNGEDRYEPDPRLLANPGIFAIPPGGRQVVRLGLLADLPDDRETAFRLFIQELQRASTDGAAPGAVRIPLVITVPVFYRPSGSSAEPQAVLERTRNGADLAVTNDGTSHLVVTGFRDGDGRQVNLSGYVLPGATRRWQLSEVPTSDLCIVMTDAGDLTLACRP